MARSSKDLSESQDSESLVFKKEHTYEKIPALKFRDVVIAKKFGSSPYEADR